MRYLTFARPVMLSLLVGLFSVTASQQSFAAQKDLGNLNPVSDWKIGTVTANDGSVYCAMVNQYDKDTVLAFSRSKRGDNSIAIDFRDKFLVEGVRYSVNTEVDKVRGFSDISRSYSGSASSNNSLVVNTGDDVPLYNALSKDGRLSFSTSAVEASFNIRDFKPSYAVLVDCAGSLNNEGPRVSSAPVDSVDRVDLESDFRDRYQTLESKYKNDMYLEKERSTEKIKLLNDRYDQIAAELKKQKNGVEILRVQQQEQEIAKKAMQDVIKSKDEEIAKLKESQKQNLSLIEDLTRQKQELIAKENKAESKQKELTDLLSQQRKKVAELEEKLNGYKSEKDSIKQKLSSKEKEIEELYLKKKLEDDKKVVELESRSSGLSNRINELQRENRKLEGQIEAAKQSARIIEDIVVERDNVSLQEIISQYQKKIVDLKAEYEKQVSTSEGYKSELNRKIKEVARLREENEQKAKLASGDVEKQISLGKDLSSKIAKLESDNAYLREEIASTRRALNAAENSAVKNKGNDVKAEVEKCRQRVAELERKYREQEDERLRLKAELEDKNNKFLEVSEKSFRQKETETDLSRKISYLEEDNKKLKDEIVIAKRALRDAEASSQNSSSILRDEIDEYRSKLSDLELKYRSQEDSKGRLESQLKQKERDISEVYERRLADSKKQVAELMDREQELSGKVMELEDKNHSLEMAILETKRSMQDVQRMSENDKNAELTKILEAHQKRIDELRVKADEQRMVEQQLRQQLAEKDKEIILARQENVQGKDEVINDLVQRERDLSATVERLRFENSKLEADIDIARKAFSRSNQEPVSVELEGFDLPEIISKQVAKTSQIAESLSEAKKTYEQRLTEFNEERRDLKERIEMLELENKTVKDRNNDIETSAESRVEQTKDMQSRMLEMAKQREELKESLKAQEHQNKLLEAALKAKEETLSSTGTKYEDTTDKLSKVREELMRIKSEKEALVADLQEKLEDKTNKYEALKAQFDGKMSMLSKEHQLVAEIALQEETVNQLKKSLDDTEKKRSETIKAIARLKDIERSNSDKLQSVAKDKSDKSSLDIANLTRERSSILSRLATARAEKDNIRKNISGSLSSGGPVSLIETNKKEAVSDIKDQLSNLEIQLASAGQQKQELSDMLEQKTRELRQREDKLKAEENELVNVKVMFPATRQKLEEIRSQLEKVEAERISELGELKGKLKDKIAEYDALEKEFDKKSQLMPNISKLEIELGLTDNNIKKLENELASVDARLKKSTQDKFEAEKIIDEKQIEFAEDTKVKLKTAEEMAIKLDKEYTKYESNLVKESKKLEDLQAEFQDVLKTNAPVKQVNSDLNKQLADANKYIGNMELELQQAHNDNLTLAAKIDEILEKTSPLQEYKDKIQEELIQSKSKLAAMTFDLEKAAEEKARLESQLKSQDEIMADLRKDLESNSKSVPENFKKSVELELKKEEIQRLQGELIDIKAKYTDSMQRVFDVQSQLADANAAKSSEAEGVSKQLLTAESEIYELKKHITEMEMQVAPILLDRDRAVSELDITKSRLTDLEAEMVALSQQKQQLAIRLEERNQQIYSLQDELARKEQEIVDLRHVLEESNRMLTEARMEMDNLKPEYQSVVNDLVVQLKNKISQYDDLQAKYNEHVSAIPAISEVEAELSANKDSIIKLEEKLSEVNEERRKAQAEAIRARAALEKAYVRMETLNNSGAMTSPAVINQKLSNIDRTQEQQLDNIKKEETLENAEISLKKTTRAQELEEAKTTQRKIAETKMVSPKPVDKSVQANKTVSKAEEFLSRVMSYHRPGDTPQPLPEAKNRSSYYQAEPEDLMAGADSYAEKNSKNVDLQSLLKIAGVSLDNLTPVENLSNYIVTQWQSDRVTGMYEQTPSQGKFRDQVDNYIERYRTDCTVGLKERITPEQKAKVGNIITADVECGMKDNSYANSILFLDDNDGFVAIANTAYPTEKARVTTIRDSLVRNLKRAEEFLTPVSMKRKENANNFKLNISEPSNKDEKKTSSEFSEELETVIIQ